MALVLCFFLIVFVQAINCNHAREGVLRMVAIGISETDDPPIIAETPEVN